MQAGIGSRAAAQQSVPRDSTFFGSVATFEVRQATFKETSQKFGCSLEVCDKRRQVTLSLAAPRAAPHLPTVGSGHQENWNFEAGRSFLAVPSNFGQFFSA